MAKPLRPKRGTTAKNDAFTGLASEITIDTDKRSIRVHDGVTAGGHEILPKAKNDELYAPKDLDVGVTSFNGSKGSVTYSAPVSSVNGQTGAVTVDVGVTSVNGKTGAVTGIVTSVNGTNADASGNVAIDVGGFDVPKGDMVDAALTVSKNGSTSYTIPVGAIVVLYSGSTSSLVPYVNGYQMPRGATVRVPANTVIRYDNTGSSITKYALEYWPI